MITKPRTLTNLWIDIASLVVMLGLAATGGLIYFVLPPGTTRFRQLFGWSRHDIGQVHFYFAVAAVMLLALHLLLHWSWVCCVVAKALGRGFPSQRTRIVWGVGLLLGITLFLVGGLWWASRMVRPRPLDTLGRRQARIEGPPVPSCQDVHPQAFIGKLKVIPHAVSLGATESLICIPYLTTMLYMPPERRTTFGVKENTIRLSVGMEPLEALVEDLDQELKAVSFPA